MHERGHHEVATSIANQPFNLAFIVALAGAAIPVINYIVRQHRAEALGAVAGAIRHDPGDQALVIIVKDRPWNPAEEGKRMNMSVQPGLGVRRRVGPDVAGVTVWQIECKEIGFPLDATDHDQGFAEIGLRMARGM